MRTIEFNGIRITSECETNYIFNTFAPNEGTTSYQEDIPICRDGSIRSNIRYETRVVNVLGNIIADSEEELYKAKQDLYNSCNGKTKAYLYYFDGFKKYRSEAIADLPSLGKMEGFSYSFNINFNLINFFWEESNTIVLPVRSRIDTVGTSFTLPCSFTTKVSEQTITNNTPFNILPVIKIHTTVSNATGNIEIKNETTGTSIILSGCTVTEGDTITIDCDNIKAFNDNGDNLLNYFNDFDDWCIIPGKNIIKGLNNESGSDLDISISYNNKLIGV